MPKLKAPLTGRKGLGGHRGGGKEETEGAAEEQQYKRPQPERAPATPSLLAKAGARAGRAGAAAVI